jgi:hypothetical protein
MRGELEEGMTTYQSLATRSPWRSPEIEEGNRPVVRSLEIEEGETTHKTYERQTGQSLSKSITTG